MRRIAPTRKVELPSDTELQALREKAKQSLYFFAVAILGYNKASPRLHKPLCDFLQSPAKRKLIVAPRGYFKTTFAVIAYSLWRIIRNPNIRILWAYNTMSNAEAKMAELMAHVETNQRLQAIFPEIIPDFKATIWTRQKLVFPRQIRCSEGTIDAAGVSTDLASRHYNLIIEDDPIAAKRDQMREEELMPSAEDISKGIGMHRMLYNLRAPDEPGLEFERVVVGTRWCVDDLIGWILEHEPEYAVFQRSAEDENGNSAYPEIMSTEELHKLRDVSMGPYIYASQMLLQPIAADLQSFKPEWLSHYWESDVEGGRRYVFVDPNHRGSGTGSKAGIVPLVVRSTGYIDIYPCICYRTEPDMLIKIILKLVEQMSADNGEKPTVVIEDVGGQHVLIPYLREKMGTSPFPLIAHKPSTQRSKDNRILGLVPWFSGGKVRFPRHDGGVLRVAGATLIRSARKLRDQLLQFPFSKDKDLADALAMAPRVVAMPAPPAQQEEVNPHSVKRILDRMLGRGASLVPNPLGKLWEEHEVLVARGVDFFRG